MTQSSNERLRELKMDTSIQPSTAAADLHEKLRVLDPDAYTREACERYADEIAEVPGSRPSAAR